MTEFVNLWGEIEVVDETTVCPVHLQFVPCRRCPPGQERYSTDPDDVRRTQQFQWGYSVRPLEEET